MGAIFLQGDSRYVLRGLPSDFFHCVVTSPPYFGLRKYEGGEAVLEPIAQSTIVKGKQSFGGAKGRAYVPSEDDPNFRGGAEQWGRTYDYTESNSSGGRNLRSVWCVPTRPSKFNHYAAYPPRLPEICIKASVSEKGCCPECGAPWARVLEKGRVEHDGATACKDLSEQGNARRLALMRQAARERGGEYANVSRSIGWGPTCTCSPASPVPCRVLDCFLGAGTTALVCERLGLDSVSVDTSAEYIELSRQRLADDEQKRVDEFIKQAKREARDSAKNAPRGLLTSPKSML